MTTYSIARVEKHMAVISTYIDAETEKSTKSVLGRTSGFWAVEFAARPNYPSVSDYLAFRREGFTHGMADGFSFDLVDARKQNLTKEEDHARRTYEIFRKCAAPDRIAAIDESALGAPFVFANHGVHRSASFWTNAATALRVKDILDAQGLTNRPVNVLEIGAGWGCMAHQVHQLFDIRSYAIVDLSENLFLSSTYVSSTLGLNLQFASGAPNSVVAEPNSLLCSVPGAVFAIGQKYEAVVNTFSLQEMELDTVQGYLAWVAQILSDDGVFISFNSHGKSGVRAPSDYPLTEFHLDHLGMFRDYPSGLMNTIPYEMVLSPRKGRTQVDPVLLNTLCCLIQFGLGDDLKPICSQFVQHSVPPETDKALRDLTGFFSLSQESRTNALAKTAAGLPASLHQFLTGLDAFAKGDQKSARPAFEAALDGGLKGFARLRACAHLALLTKQKTLPKWNEDFDARMAYPELAKILDESNMSQFAAQFERIVSVELPGVSVER